MANANEECIATQGKKTNFYQNKSQKVCLSEHVNYKFFTSALHLMHFNQYSWNNFARCSRTPGLG